jgi:hypothetical protein
MLSTGEILIFLKENKQFLRIISLTEIGYLVLLPAMNKQRIVTLIF